MKLSIVCVALVNVALPVASICAQQAQVQTNQDFANTVRILERQVEAAQDRVDTIAGKLKATDDQIERRIERVLSDLVKVTDSADSRTRVTQAKEDAFDALLRNIQFYARERDQRFAKLYQPANRWAKESLAEDVKRLNARIAKRVDQALAVVASLPAEQNIPRKTVYFDGEYTEMRTNPAYSRQRRVMAQGSQLRDKAYAALKASVDRLQRSRLELDRAMKYAKTEEGRSFVKELIDQNTEWLAKRQEQILTALRMTNPGANALGNDSANALLKQIQEEKMHFQKDNAEWIRLKNDRDFELSRLHTLQAELARYQRQAATTAP